MIELALTAHEEYENPFTDVRVRAVFTSPSGAEHTIAGFYDGDRIWRVRFRPNEAGRWRYRVSSEPHDEGLASDGSVAAKGERGSARFLEATPGENWGFTYADGQPCFLLGDTLYNLFGGAYCGVDVERLLRRRAEQGFNIFRARCQVSPQHPRSPENVWETRSTWPWGGSREEPQLDRLNPEWFRCMDDVMRLAEELDVGFEMILEAWGFEFPFNDRATFTEELERLWLGYLIARYDAFNSVYVWTLMNEYEYYPEGKFQHNVEADEWAMRTARWLKSIAPHGHPITVHNGPRQPPFAERFATDLDVIDVIMFQTWGTTKEPDAWLAAGIEDTIAECLAGWPGSAVFAEYGYERAEDIDSLPPGHNHLWIDHTRRGGWRGAFSALGVIGGFGYTWGPYLVVDRDQPGVAQTALVKRFFTDVVGFETLRPAPALIVGSSRSGAGEKPLCLADPRREQVVVYLPVGGSVRLDLSEGRQYEPSWFDPRTGDLQRAISTDAGEFAAPAGGDPHPHDWVLVLR